MEYTRLSTKSKVLSKIRKKGTLKPQRKNTFLMRSINQTLLKEIMKRLLLILLIP